MSLDDRIREHVGEHRTGMIHDLMFAVVWVAIVTLLFDLVFVEAPTYAYYLLLATGIPAYFAFFWSLAYARHLKEVERAEDG